MYEICTVFHFQSICVVYISYKSRKYLCDFTLLLDCDQKTMQSFVSRFLKEKRTECQTNLPEASECGHLRLRLRLFYRPSRGFHEGGSFHFLVFEVAWIFCFSSSNSPGDRFILKQDKIAYSSPIRLIKKLGNFV